MLKIKEFHVNLHEIFSAQNNYVWLRQSKYKRDWILI
jgi:hypothetical protein